MHERFEQRLVEIADSKLRSVETHLHDLAAILRRHAADEDAAELSALAAQAEAVAAKLATCKCSAAEFQELMMSLAAACEKLQSVGALT